MTVPPFPYFGGKQTLAARIVATLPGHRHYVEPFAGSLAVLLAKPESVMETVNDLDGDLMVFWRVLREQPVELERACALTPHARAEHLGSYQRENLSELERARRVWVCLTQGRGATLRPTGWRHYVKPTGDTGLPAYLAGYTARIPAAAARLRRVSLECRPACEVIAVYGAEPAVLLYVDPPYLGATRGADPSRAGTGRYHHELLGEAEHAQMLDALLGCRAAVVISGYPSPLYDARLAGWARCEFPTGTGQSAVREWSTRTEVLWSNRPLAHQLDLFDRPTHPSAHAPGRRAADTGRAR